MAEFKTLDERALKDAVDRGKFFYGQPKANSARFDQERHCIVIRLQNGDDVFIGRALEPALADPSIDDLEAVAVDGVGTAVRFPTLDVDLTISRLPGYPRSSG